MFLNLKTFSKFQNASVLRSEVSLLYQSYKDNKNTQVKGFTAPENQGRHHYWLETEVSVWLHKKDHVSD